MKRRRSTEVCERDDTPPQEYFSRAARAVQLKTALARNLDPNTVDAEIAATAFHADEETRRRLRHLFEKSDEVRYSGSGQNGNRTIPPETRNEVLELDRKPPRMKQHLFLVRLAVIALGFATAGPARGDQNPAFTKANEDYSAGRFQEAVDGYQNLVNSGQSSANLFYDLGNAWFRLGNFGESILNYERALALDPHHPEAAPNLGLVRDEARALELKRSGLERYIEAGTSTQYSIAAAIAFWFALFGAARLFFLRRRSVSLVLLIIFSTVVCAGAVYALYSLETGSKGRDLAIVTGKNIEARLATADNAKSVLALPPGSEIKILSQRGDWVYAALPNDLRGWIPANGARRVRM